ncbi:RDD family protein [Thalassotalea sp. LPB0316]|uniref:RDD family protein n=1 Tax=Thalassotalea sp. LPB0316 TaxID=2769490 RepID=UPI001866DCEC|nr:RDD family protein [Thalassotalea sp. LPB0316]QOL25858.1 RDD family protein [Thalassotalea sp. LPB0316]
MSSPELFPRAGFRRRFGSWIYDFLVAVAIYMVTTMIVSAIFNTLFAFELIGANTEQTASDYFATSILFKVILNCAGLLAIIYFFIFFWAKSGQTIGMKAWRLRVQNQDGSLMSKKTGIKRLLPTLLGLGNLLVIFDRKNKLSLQDRLTNTEVVVLTLEANRPK